MTAGGYGAQLLPGETDQLARIAVHGRRAGIDAALVAREGEQMNRGTDGQRGHTMSTYVEAQRGAEGRPGAAVAGGARDRRAPIIAATMRLIAREGVAALSTCKIAREAAVNLATLHALFGRKDDLLLAVLDAATSTLIAALVVDAQPGKGLRAALADSFATLCALLDQGPALPLVRCEVLLYARLRPAQAAAALQQQQRYLDAMAVCYRVAGAEGELGLMPSEDLAAVVSSSIDGLAVQTAAGVPVPQQAATRAHVLRGLLALVPTHPHTRDHRSTDGLLTIVVDEDRCQES
jgi:AcrR family transcriptional regulator